MINELPPHELKWSFSYQPVSKNLSSKKNKDQKIATLTQKVAISALEMGLGIKQKGYNIFVVGSSGTGRTSTVQKILQEKAQDQPTPDDLVLLYNFKDKDRPLTIRLPAAMGPKLKKTYEQVVEKVISHIEKAFDSERYLLAKQSIEESSKRTTDEALRTIEKEANQNSFVVSHSGASITLTPASEDNRPLTENEFEELSSQEKALLEKKAEKLEAMLEDSMRKVKQAEKESEDATEKLDRETAAQAIESIFEGARSAWKSNKQVVAHLNDIEEDVLNRVHKFTQEEKISETEKEEHPKTYRHIDEEDDHDYEEHFFLRYKVNILVTRSKSAGGPIIFETHPTASNLIGRIEQKIKAGETVTDFTRIKAGALYKANGGYLVLEAQELIRDIAAWEGLKRSLKNGLIELDDPGEPGRMISTASLRPEPVKMDLKVILVGTPEIYYALSKNDPDFSSLFKVKADFDIEIEKTPQNIDKYIDFIRKICREEKLLSLTYSGFEKIIEQAVRLAGNNAKITPRIGDIANLLRESDYWAQKKHAKSISKEHIQMALKARAQREGYLETQILDEIVSRKLSLDTKGKKIGQTNALTIIDMGNYEFGVGLRVSCQIASGDGIIVDIEKETRQSGPFHSKGRLIIKGLLSKLFGRILPFSFSATLCMEQTYSDVDGDSASLAEACALLSSLSQTPIDQSFSMTGAIDQEGNVQAVGGVNEKIEGFFNICKALKSKHVNTVIIPWQNVDDLMLNEEVIEHVKKKNFRVVTAENVMDVMELITNIPWTKGKESLEKRCIASLKHLNTINLQKKNLTFMTENKGNGLAISPFDEVSL